MKTKGAGAMVMKKELRSRSCVLYTIAPQPCKGPLRFDQAVTKVSIAAIVYRFSFKRLTLSQKLLPIVFSHCECCLLSLPPSCGGRACIRLWPKRWWEFLLQTGSPKLDTSASGGEATWKLQLASLQQGKFASVAAYHMHSDFGAMKPNI